MRIRPSSVKNPKSFRQLNQRTRFGLAVRMVHANGVLVRIGFQPYAGKVSPLNAAVSHALQHAITGEHPDVRVDFSKVMLSHGELAGVENLQAVAVAPASLHLQWTDNSDEPGARAGDRLMVSLLDAEELRSSVHYAVATRSDAETTLKVPLGWAGRSVHVYAFFLSELALNSSVTRKQVSDTAWAGSLVLE